jgi:hypothetical protein
VTAPPEQRRAVGAVTSTTTGFASLLMVLDDPFAAIPGLTAILATSSTDGIAWTFTTVPPMKDMQLGGLLGTSHGVFAWGMLPHEDGGAAPEPLLLVHLAPLP